MIALPEYFPQLTPAEYLAWEGEQELRHEYVDGQVRVRDEVDINHSRICINFCCAIDGNLDGHKYRLLGSDAKVHITESNSFFYPDVSVTCDERDRSAIDFLSHPCLIGEVLFPSTEAYDRGDKFSLYRRSPDLQEYVLVSTNEVCVDVYQRNERNRWELFSYDSGDLIELKSINFTCPIEQVYEDIVFNPE